MPNSKTKPEGLAEALQHTYRQVPSYLLTEEVKALLPHIGKPIQKYDELYHLWRKACASSFFFACKAILNTLPPEDDLMSPITHGPLTLFVEQDYPTHKLFEFPRKCLKSSIVTRRAWFHTLANKAINGEDPYDRHFILSHGFKLAQKHWWGIKEIFESNSDQARLFRFLFGDELRPSDKWNENMGVLVREWNPEDASFEPLAKRSAGKHCDVCYADDLIDEENYDSEDAVNKAVTYLRLANNWLEGPTSRLWVIGNRWGLNDVNATIHDNHPEFAILSVNAEEGPNLIGEFKCRNLSDKVMESLEALAWLAEKNGTIWPERFTKQYLKRQREELGDAIYASQFLNLPEDPAAMEFDSSRIGKAKLIHDEEHGPTLDLNGKKVPLKSTHVYVSWDPAAEEKRKSCENAIVAAAYTPDEDLVVIQESARIEDPFKSVNRFLAMCRAWQGYLVASCVEEVAFQRILKKIIRISARFQRTYTGLRKIKTPTGKSKDQRIRFNLGWFVESGKLYVLDTCPKTYKQLRLFGVRGARRDLIDALSNLVQLLERPLSLDEIEELEQEAWESELASQASLDGYGSALAI